MSLNIIATWPAAIVAVSDRRVTDFLTKAITNRSTKLTVFGCSDAHGVVAYNGIGTDDKGETPSEWLMQLADKKLFDSTLLDLLEGVRADLEIRLAKFRERRDSKKARHTVGGRHDTTTRFPSYAFQWGCASDGRLSWHGLITGGKQQPLQQSGRRCYASQRFVLSISSTSSRLTPLVACNFHVSCRLNAANQHSTPSGVAL